MDDHASWIGSLGNPLVLIGFVIMLFVGILRWIIRGGGRNIPRNSTARLIAQGLRFAFWLSLLVVVLGFGLSFLTRLKSDNPDPSEVLKWVEDAEYLEAYENPEKYNAWMIRESDLPEVQKQGILDVMRLFRENKYSKSRQALLSLPEDHKLTCEFKRDFRAAILHEEGDYVGALESILKRYEGLPVNDIRYRWEIAYVTYYFRRKKGVLQCEEAIGELQNKYRRPDISYVWMAIHPGALKRLLSYDLSPEQDLHPLQMDLLSDIVSSHPNDPFIDHAYYFLHEYDRIIREHPNSIILDRAYYAKACREYGTELWSSARPPSDDRLKTVAADYGEFIDRYRAHELTPRAIGDLTDCLLRISDTALRMTPVKNLIDRVLSWQGGDVTDKTRERCVDAVKYRLMQYFGEWESDYSEGVLDNLAASGHLSVLGTDDLILAVARRAFAEDDFERSFRLYSAVSSEDFPQSTGETLRYRALERIHNIGAETGSIEYLTELIFALKSTKYSASKAIEYIDTLLDKHGASVDVPRFLMLKAFCYRDSDMRREMDSLYSLLLREYPNSVFADDALAELGVTRLLWGWPDYENARACFRACIAKYPDGNAVDNCHNWIAWSYLKEGNYRKAYEKYQENLALFPWTRFAGYAAKNIEKMVQEHRLQ